MAFVRYYVGDVVKMKKSHPCGSAEWEVKRIGTDFNDCLIAVAVIK